MRGSGAAYVRGVVLVTAMVVGLVLSGCEGGPASDAGAGGATGASGTTPSGATGTMAAPDAPDGRWGFGEPASEAWIDAWDIDVGPTGDGLPPGSGTAMDGAELYRTQCQACHGETGVEGPNNVLVSPEPLDEFAFGSDPRLRSTIGNYWPYATTVFDYVRRSMPFDRPGILTDDEVYAVTAWLLWMNRLIADDQVMDAESLPAVEMPAREHFVPSADVSLDALP